MPDIFDEVSEKPAGDIFDQLEAEPAPQAPEEPGRITRRPQSAGDWGRFMLGGLLHPIRQTETAIEQAAIRLGLADPGSRLLPGVSLSRAMERPFATIPQIPQQEGAAAQLGAGAVNAVTDFVNFFLTPEGISTFGLGSIPATARKAILTGFAGSMATQAPEQLNAAVEAAKAGDLQAATQQALSGAGGVAFSAAIGNTLSRPAANHPSVTLPRSFAQLEKSGAGRASSEVSASSELPPKEPAALPVPPLEKGPADAIQEQQAAQVLRDVPEQPRGVEQGLPTPEGAERIPQGEPPGETARRQAIEAAQGELPLVPPEPTAIERQAEAVGPREAQEIAQLQAARAEQNRTGLPGGAVEVAGKPGDFGITPQPSVAAKELVNAGVGFSRWYSEWMPDRIRRIGLTSGGAAKRFANTANEVLSKSNGYYGKLTPTLDPARAEAGRMGPATQWAHGLKEVTPRTAVANAVDAVEGAVAPPAFARELVRLAQAANLEIGKLLEPVIPGFKATGKWQRNLTGFGHDLVRRGSGKVWDAWTEGLAVANNMSIQTVRNFFKNWKAELDKSGDLDVSQLEKINQDFAREMPKAVTHVMVDSVMGPHWEPVIHANLFNYLEATAKRAATVRAFREEFPKDTIGQVFSEVMADIPGQYKADFQGLMRALNGHPTDSYEFAGRIGLAPDQPVGAAFRTLNQTVGNFMSRLVLTGQIITQTPETVVGATPVFLGYKNYLKALATHRELYPQLEQNGQLNRVLYDNSFDPSSPIRSAWRIAGNTVSKTFAEQFLNEMQEATAATTASIVAEKIRTRSLSEWEQGMLPVTFRAMGFTKGQAQEMIAGRAPELLTQFERKAASWLTSGNKAIAEGSLAGASRLFNSVFRFQSYPMMKMNQFRRTLGAAVDAWQEGKTPAEKMAGVRLLGRFMFGTTAQGALYVGLTSLVMNQLFGFKVASEEAKDEPLEFLVESFIASMGGPLYMVWRGARSQGTLGVGEQFARTFFPYQIVSSLWDMTHGDGAYRDLDAGDRLGKFVEQRIPGSRLISSGLAMFGLGQENKKLQTSLRAFYRWRIEEMGLKREVSHLKEDPNKEFRTHMKQAVDALQKGDRQAYGQALMKASGAPNSEPGSIARSFRGRKVLKTPTGKKLSPEQMKDLRERIGDEAVQQLVYYDAMLEAAAEGVILPPKK